MIDYVGVTNKQKISLMNHMNNISTLPFQPTDTHKALLYEKEPEVNDNYSCNIC